MLKKIINGAILTVVFVMLAGCSTFAPVKYTPVSFYTLRQVSTTKLATKSAPVVLLVSTPTSIPAFQTAHIIYVEKPYKIQAFTRNSWISPPVELLQPLLVESLRNSHYFQAVIAPPFTGNFDYRLNTQIVKFQQSFLTKPSQFEIILQAALINNSNTTVIAMRRFSATVIAKGDNPYDGVIAANQALKKLLQQLSVFCVREIKTNRQHLLPSPKRIFKN